MLGQKHWKAIISMCWRRWCRLGKKSHWPIESPDPVEAILFAMEQRDLSPRDLEALIGSRARAAEVLNHKRSLTLPMIRRLHEGLGIPAEVLIG
jgi:HTH-type transcriptional regulator/antitoxin HigA